jgi:hypothetical protein
MMLSFILAGMDLSSQYLHAEYHSCMVRWEDQSAHLVADCIGWRALDRKQYAIIPMLPNCADLCESGVE